MKRLTETNDGRVFPADQNIHCSVYCTSCTKTECSFINKCLLRLAAYEDIGSPEEFKAYKDAGLTPDEINGIKADVDDLKDRVDNLFESQRFVQRLEDKGVLDVNASVDRAIGLLEAEQDGRLVVLPCKIGDTVYLLFEKQIHELRVQGISVSASGKDTIMHFGGYPVTNVWGSEMGRTLFLTREEAEKAMKGVSEDAD